MMNFLQGMVVLGKTIVAARDIYRKDVRCHFNGSISWMNIGQKNLGSTVIIYGMSSSLSYGDFMYHLRKLSSILGFLYCTLLRWFFFLVMLHTYESKNPPVHGKYKQEDVTFIE